MQDACQFGDVEGLSGNRIREVFGAPGGLSARSQARLRASLSKGWRIGVATC